MVVVPILIMLRYIMDNMANIQINVYLLLGSCLTINFFLKNQANLAGLFLGLIISLKVYPIIFLIFVLFKREFKTAAWTVLFILIFNAIPFLFFGIETAIQHYSFWFEKVAKNSVFSTHRNQSLYAFLIRLLTTEPSGSISINIAELSAVFVKKITYLIIMIISIIPAFIFRNKIKEKLSFKTIIEFAFIFASIPIISPLAWKAYFIFLWLPYLVIYLILFRLDYNVSLKKNNVMKGMFYCSLILTIFSTEAFTGSYISDVLETFGAITFGTIITNILLVIFHLDYDKINFKSLVLKKMIFQEKIA